MRCARILTYLMAATLSVAGCAAQTPQTPQTPQVADAGAGALVSEGVDTPIEVVGYTSFSTDAFRFLGEGDKVAVISPSSLPTTEAFEATMAGLEKWGFVPVAGAHACVEERTLDDCVEDLTWALGDPELKAVFCVRGGYGSSEVMDRLPLSLVEQANKPIIGYSDVTDFHAAWTCAHVPSIHSSMSATFTGLPEECADVERRMLAGEVPTYRCQGSDYDVPGTAQGILVGGNLSTFTSALGTAYDSTATDEPYILFLEDVGEDWRHIHRYLTVLDHLGVLDRAAGIVFGEWVDYPAECADYGGGSRGGAFASVADMICREFLDGRDVPVAFGFPAGHGDANYPLLMGTQVSLDVYEGGYTLEWQAPTA